MIGEDPEDLKTRPGGGLCPSVILFSQNPHQPAIASHQPPATARASAESDNRDASWTAWTAMDSHHQETAAAAMPQQVQHRKRELLPASSAVCWRSGGEVERPSEQQALVELQNTK